MTTPKNCFFHPYEFSFCGFSNSGKTTLIEKLIHYFADDFDIGIIKHDAHHFKIDHPGKDSYRFYQAGAKTVIIGNDEKTAIQTNHSYSSFDYKEKLFSCDFVFVEGHKNLTLPKFIIVDDDFEILNEDHFSKLEKVWGLIFKDKKHQDKYIRESKDQMHKLEVFTKEKLKIFYRDEVEKIACSVLGFFSKNKPIVKALILAGGRSSRMGKDKSLLNYYGIHHIQYSYNLLKSLNENIAEVYVSLRSEQIGSPHLSDLPYIEDQFLGLGPTGGILSAFQHSPDASWLVLAIDLPHIDKASIMELLEQRNPFKMATCFINPEKKWPEPLFTIWEPKSRPRLHWFSGLSRNCPRKVLFNSPIKCLTPSHQFLMKNCNTMDDFMKAKEIIQTCQKS